jgi:hypothetical protein
MPTDYSDYPEVGARRTLQCPTCGRALSITHLTASEARIEVAGFEPVQEHCITFGTKGNTLLGITTNGH